MNKQAGSQDDAAALWFGRTVLPMQSYDKEASADFVSDLQRAADESDLKRLAEMLHAGGELPEFLGAVASLSPFLRGIALRRPRILEQLFELPLADRLGEIEKQLVTAAHGDDVTEQSIMKTLRGLKNEAHFLIALDDLAGGLAPGVTVKRLSALADAAVNAAVDFLLLDAGRTGKMTIANQGRPGKDSGLIILAMGKLGAGELNFSSDIDLVVFYDPRVPAIAVNDDHEEFFPRMMRRLVRLIHDRTSDGYVFRTDLRLRPDPGSTPLAIPIGAALHYYESRGQNWERAAFIKAHPVAGDIAAGEAFLAELAPFVWRKYMDYASIAEVHSIKRQIYAHKGHGEVAVNGHNVKLGRGGIREIEFFVQTQQLIAGGRFHTLRGRQTIVMINELKKLGWIGADALQSMTECYWYLRDVENRLQMIGDEQVHNLPEDDDELRVIALMMREDDEKAFADRFRSTLKTVERHYAALFEAEPKASSHLASLVFTSEVDDPGTLEALSDLGFERPKDIYRVIRNWHAGRYRATQSAVARDHLGQLTPSLLEAFAETARADEALLRFDSFLSGMPAGVQLFSLLHSNPSLLNLLVTIMAAAPRLAETITRRPHVFDGLLDPALMTELPNRDYLSGRLEAMLADAILYEDVLDRLRIFAAEQKFLIGIRLLTGAIDAQRAGKAFSDLADLTIGRAFAAVRGEFALRHGHVPGATAAILGMGKLGSREMTAGSDVDLILLYDHDPAIEQSDGEKPLATSHYFARLTQRLIAAVSAPTAEGILYEIDMRLRPSGNKGPVATHFEGFSKYQRNEAWTWEHMALTRARPFAGDELLCGRIGIEIAEILALPRDRMKSIADAVEMRRTIAEEKPPRDLWDLKLVEGGIIDIEFIAQIAVLTGSLETGTKKPGTAETITAIADGFAGADARSDLVTAWHLYSQFMQVTRLCLDGPFDIEQTPPGLADLLLRQTGHPDMEVLAAHLKETEGAVRDHFCTLLGDPDS